MDTKELYDELEELAAQAGDLRDLAAQNVPVATKDAAATLYKAIVGLLRRVERGDEALGSDHQMADPDGNAAAPAGLLRSFQNLITLAAGSLGLVAAIGLPAIAMHLERFDVPLGVANYNDVLRAGAMPTIVLMVIVLYGFVAARAIAATGARVLFAAAHTLVLLPALVVVYLLGWVGALCQVMVVIWAMLWGLKSLLGRFIEIDANNRTLLMLSAGILVLIAIGSVVMHLVKRRVASAGEASATAATPSTTSSTGSKGSDDKKFSWWWVPVSSLFVLGMVYSIKGLLHIWDPALGALLSHQLVWTTVGLMVAVYALFFGGIYVMVSNEEEGGPSPRRTAWVVAVAAVAFVVFEAWYCMWMYPRMYSGFGGGRPVPATLWLESADHADDVRTVLANARISERDSLRSIENVFVVLDVDNQLLVTDGAMPRAKAVLVSKDRIKAVSW